MLSAYYRHTTSETPLHRVPAYAASKQMAPDAESRIYRLVVMTMPRIGSEPERAFLSLQRNQPILDYLVQRMSESERPMRTIAELDGDADRLARRYALPFEHVRRMLPRDIRQPNTLLRPFVLRATRSEQIEIHVTNCTPAPMALALLDDDYGIQQRAELLHPLAPGESGVYCWQCKQTGIYPIFNEACPKTAQQRCLLGVLMIEP